MKKKLSNEAETVLLATDHKKWKSRRPATAAKKCFAVMLIFALAAADVFAMQELFGKLNTDPIQKWVYSLTFALCLEGIPTFMGTCLSKLADTTKYKRNDFWSAVVGLVFSSIGIVIAFWMAWDLRATLIESYGGAEAFANGNYGVGTTLNYQPEMNSGYLKDRFLLFSPMVTSVLAFVTSWMVFPSDHYAQLEREMDEQHRQFIDAESEFHVARETMELARIGLWKDLADSDTNMPRSTNVFRKECFARIRNLLFTDCINKYRLNIADFNSTIESELRTYISKMAQHTTIEDVIGNIKLEDVIKEYNQRIKSNDGEAVNCWDYNTAIVPLEDDLKQLLNNAIVVAQFKSTTTPRYKEGRKW